ncbi:hypothetical protein M9H77_27511 [Catharanthus roseus]|uniref:Uncharacterized protein n=1 Tax=Catharanthus roseus TaxID=4058 RepID=A0ACC0AH06_CATRO|nr:hypothetical protein M9H77_27511 [Catharanthus roseus]
MSVRNNSLFKTSIGSHASNFATVINRALNKILKPPLTLTKAVLHVCWPLIQLYVGLVGYVGTNPHLKGYKSKRLLTGLLEIESGQDAVIRTYRYERKISALINKLAECGNKDEGVIVPLELGAENKTTSNVLSANAYSIAYTRTQADILRIVYDTGNLSKRRKRRKWKDCSTISEKSLRNCSYILQHIHCLCCHPM